jgi:hypothetical protein
MLTTGRDHFADQLHDGAVWDRPASSIGTTNCETLQAGRFAASWISCIPSR